jgi:hypothetical protein
VERGLGDPEEGERGGEIFGVRVTLHSARLLGDFEFTRWRVFQQMGIQVLPRRYLISYDSLTGLSPSISP